MCKSVRAHVYTVNKSVHCTHARVRVCVYTVRLNFHSKTPPGENQIFFVTLTVRTYVWIVPNWTLQQSTAKSTDRQVQQIVYQSKL